MKKRKRKCASVSDFCWELYRYHFALTGMERFFCDVCKSTVEWYYGTGRACLAWEKALLRADPRKLADSVIKQRTGCEVDALNVINKYLSRYFGLDAV